MSSQGIADAQQQVCCWSECFVFTHVLNLHLPVSEQQHWSNNLLINQSCQFLAHRILKCHDTVGAPESFEDFEV